MKERMAGGIDMKTSSDGYTTGREHKFPEAPRYDAVIQATYDLFHATPDVNSSQHEACIPPGLRHAVFQRGLGHVMQSGRNVGLFPCGQACADTGISGIVPFAGMVTLVEYV